MKMKPVIIKSDFLMKIFSVVQPAVAITLWPFIIVKEDKKYSEDEVLLNHESIHIRQQVENLIVPFYLIYLYDYVRGLIKYKDSSKAYYRIRFEQEAYRNQKNMIYLKERRPHSWKKYKV